MSILRHKGSKNRFLNIKFIHNPYIDSNIWLCNPSWIANRSRWLNTLPIISWSRKTDNFGISCIHWQFHFFHHSSRSWLELIDIDIWKLAHRRVFFFITFESRSGCRGFYIRFFEAYKGFCDVFF